MESVTANSKGVSIFSACCVLMNMMIGAGFLALPRAVFTGGILYSVVIILIVAKLMSISCIWEGRYSIQCSRILNSLKIPEVSESCRVLSGRYCRDLYAITLSISLVSCNWALAILFAHTMSSSIPQVYSPEVVCNGAEDDSEVCATRYQLNILILTIITTPLSIMNISEQYWIQNMLAFIRVLRMILMCVTPMLAYGAMEISFPMSFQSDYFSPAPNIFGSWVGLCQVLSCAVFGLFLNANIPIIIDALNDRNIFVRALNISIGCNVVLYLWLSLVITFQFGNNVANPCNLNWVGYRWPFKSECFTNSFCDISARAVQFFIVFCPAIDVASAYPFVSIVLGNSLTEMITGLHDNKTEVIDENTPLNSAEFKESIYSGNTFEISGSGISEADHNSNYNFVNRCLRFITNTIPLVLALTVKNFETVIQLTGGISVLICLVFPAYLSIKYSDSLAKFQHKINRMNYIYWVDKPTDFSTHLDPNLEFIELRSVKIFFFWSGLIVSGIIFYSSL